MEKIVIFGTGSVAEVLFHELNDETEIVAFVNSDENINEYHGYMVVRPCDIAGLDYDKIIVASGYYDAIEAILLENHVSPEDIVGYIFDDGDFYIRTKDEIDDYLNRRYNRSYMKRILRSSRILPKLYPSTVWKNNAFSNVRKDFVREQALAYLSQEIERRQVVGAVAELGVFKGDFTVVINEAFPKRRLYLFDTFCGFSEEDVASDDNTENKENELKKFKDTSVELVLSRLRSDSDCVVKKGYFPDTFDLQDESFAFVSVDLNMKSAVSAALSLIWPRISVGGYMMISDYNAPFYEGTREAIQEYCDVNGITVVALPDLYGSVLLCKNGEIK